MAHNLGKMRMQKYENIIKYDSLAVKGFVCVGMNLSVHLPINQFVKGRLLRGQLFKLINFELINSLKQHLMMKTHPKTVFASYRFKR